MSTRKYDEARAGRRPCSAGFTLIETVIALFIITLMVLVSLPRLARAHREASLQGVTSTVITQMWRARSEAMTSGQSTALVFDRRRDGGWHCEIVQDGDGDGVRRSDREAGIDVTIGRRLDMDSDHVGFGILQGDWHAGADLYRSHMAHVFKAPQIPAWMRETFHGMFNISQKGGENPPKSPQAAPKQPFAPARPARHFLG